MHILTEAAGYSVELTGDKSPQGVNGKDKKKRKNVRVPTMKWSRLIALFRANPLPNRLGMVEISAAVEVERGPD